MSTSNPMHDFLDLFKNGTDKPGEKHDDKSPFSPFEGEGKKGKQEKESKEKAEAAKAEEAQQEQQAKQANKAQRDVKAAVSAVENLAQRVQAEVQTTAAKNIKTESAALKPVVDQFRSQIASDKAKPVELQAILATVLTGLQAQPLTREQIIEQKVNRAIGNAPQDQELRQDYTDRLSGKPLLMGDISPERLARLTAVSTFDRSDFLSSPENFANFYRPTPQQPLPAPDTRLSDIGRSLVEMRTRINFNSPMTMPPNLSWCKDIKDIVGDGKVAPSDQHLGVVRLLIDTKIKAIQTVLNSPGRFLRDKDFIDKVVNSKDDAKLSEFLTSRFPTPKFAVPTGMPLTFADAAAQRIKDTMAANPVAGKDGLSNAKATLSQVKGLLQAGKDTDALALISPAKTVNDPLADWYKSVIAAPTKAERINIVSDKITALTETLPSPQERRAPNLELVNLNFLDAMEKNVASRRTGQLPSVAQEAVRRTILDYAKNPYVIPDSVIQQSNLSRIQVLQNYASTVAQGIAQQLPTRGRVADAEKIDGLIKQAPLKLDITSIPVAPAAVPPSPPALEPKIPQSRNDAPAGQKMDTVELVSRVDANPVIASPKVVSKESVSPVIVSSAAAGKESISPVVAIKESSVIISPVLTSKDNSAVTDPVVVNKESIPATTANRTENPTLAAQGLQQAFIPTGSPGEIPVVGAPTSQPALQEDSQKTAQLAQAAHRDQGASPIALSGLISRAVSLYTSAIYAHAFTQSDSRAVNPFNASNSNLSSFNNSSVQDYYLSRSAYTDSSLNALSFGSPLTSSARPEALIALNNVVQRSSDNNASISNWYLNGPRPADANGATAPTEEAALYSTTNPIDTGGKPSGGGGSVPRSSANNSLSLSVIPSRSSSIARNALGVSVPSYGASYGSNSGLSSKILKNAANSNINLASNAPSASGGGGGGGFMWGRAPQWHHGFLNGMPPGEFALAGLSPNVINHNKDSDDDDDNPQMKKSRRNVFDTLVS